MSFREGQTATNPKTGQKIVYKGGQWVNAGSAPMPPRLTGAAAAAAAAKGQAAGLLSKQLDEVESLYNKNLKGDPTGTLGMMEYAPTQANRTFKAAADGMLPLVRQVFRVPGSGADSDRELQVLQNLIPDHRAYDSTNEQRIRQLRGMIKGLTGGPSTAPKADLSKMSDAELRRLAGL